MRTLSGEIAGKRRAGETLTAEEQQIMRHVFSSAGMGNGEGGRRPGGANRPGEPATDYRFGGDFWVVVREDDGSNRIAKVKTGLTDLNRVEIISGLDESERVLILPSTHLVETQEQLQQWIDRRVGNVPV